MDNDRPSQRSGAYAEFGGTFTPLFRRLEEMGLASRVVHMGKIGPRGRSADFVVDDARAFLADLEATGRFCRDTPAGRILHPGKASWREDRKARCLHVAVDPDGRVLAHLDRFSSVAAARRGRSCRYSAGRVLVHNAGRLAGDLIRFAFGHRVDWAPMLLSLRRARFRAQACPSDDPTDGRAQGLADTSAFAPAVADEVAVSDQDASPGGRGATDPPPRTRASRARLSFSTIDEAVDGLDRPAEPWSVHWEVHVSGRLDDARLRRAVAEARSRHPMARVRRVPPQPGSEHPSENSAGTGMSIRSRSPSARTTQPSSGRGRRLVGMTVPLTAPPPFRVLMARRPEGDVVILNAKHTAMDSVGAFRLLCSIARAYAEADDPEPELDVTGARPVVMDQAGDVRTRAARLKLLLEKMGDLVAVPARVAPDGGADLPGYGVHLERLDAESRGLEQLGPDAVNDVLVAVLHLTVALWNIEHGVRCVRASILMPVNLRPAVWAGDVVANLSVLARTVTNPADRSLHRVLAGVSSQTARMERERTLPALLELIGQESILPGRLRRALPALVGITGNRLVDTAALAWMGRLDHPPSFGPEAGHTVSVWDSPPARMPLGVSVGAVMAGGPPHVAFRYRRPLFSPDAACRFADHNASLLAHLLGAMSGPEQMAHVASPGA
ncbi:MAG: hypothetical protein ACRDKW_13650 [Actinomycetota bacterium]